MTFAAPDVPPPNHLSTPHEEQTHLVNFFPARASVHHQALIH